MSGPLAGLRVVELGSEIAVPYCTKLFADLGAEVYKIEQPSGDPLRSWGPPAQGDPSSVGSGLFEYLNAGKRGATVDLTREDGVRLVNDLIAQADIVVENLPADLRDAWRFDTGSHPHLVVVRVSDFGRQGPLHGRPSVPLTMQAAAGWVSTREPNRAPVQAGARIPEYVAGGYAALAGLTALRIATGSNSIVDVDVSMFESLLSTLPYPMLMAERLKRLGRPTNSKAAPMLGIVRAADGWIGINCLTGQHWLDVCAMMGLPEFGEHQLAIMLGGPERDEFFAKAQPWLDAMSVSELVELSQAMRIPAAPVTDGESIVACPQYAERGFFVESESETGQFLRPGPPFRLSKTPAGLPSCAPRLGVSDRPGWSDDKAAAIDSGVVDPVLPFAGLKVFDLSTFWAGAYLTCYLGAFGADVVKVESIQRPDGHRYSGAMLREGDDWYERGPLWQATNLNKRDITLDLTTAEGRELALRLAGEADVVVENFSPRVVEHFGLDYDALVKVNPGVVMVRMPGFGLAGPWRDYVGWALNIEQLSGMSACTGYADGPPCNLQGPADPIAGVHAAVALLAALEHRSRTGEGQLIEVAQVEVGAAVTAEPVIDYSVTGKVRPREGNRHRNHVQGVYPAAGDEWVAVAVRHDADWSALAETMGNGDVRDDPRFASQAARWQHHDAFDAAVAAWTETHEPEKVVQELVSRGVPAERVLTADRMYDIEQLDTRGYYQELVHPITGSNRFPGWPFRISPGPVRQHRTPSPMLGEHNAEVLTSLGLTADEIDELRRRQIIGERLLNA